MATSESAETNSNKDRGPIPELWESRIWDPAPNSQLGSVSVIAECEEPTGDLVWLAHCGDPHLLFYYVWLVRQSVPYLTPSGLVTVGLVTITFNGHLHTVLL